MSGWNDAEVPPSSDKGESKEWKLIEKMLLSMQSEQRKSRRWGIFFKGLTFLYLSLLLVMVLVPVFAELTRSSKIHVAVINVRGVIADEEEASASNIIAGLRHAFETPDAQAVVLRINSPGGSPVQSGYVYDEINRLRATRPEMKVYAVISEVGASGAYYIAAAADYIYADKASLVGSIGVVAGGFGFTEAMQKLGVERRLYTAGDHKGFLDPFQPEKAEEVGFWQEVLDTTHKQFIGQVRKGRGARMKDDKRLFTGLVWSGEQALELGLIDGLGSVGSVARDVIRVEELVDYSVAPSPIDRVVRQLGASFGEAVTTRLTHSSLELK